jgi:hypothetical protein
MRHKRDVLAPEIDTGSAAQIRFAPDSAERKSPERRGELSPRLIADWLPFVHLQGCEPRLR